MRRELTPKQDAFIGEYLVDFNATQAAIRAGYSQKNADRIGPELLGKTWVRASLKKAIARRAAKVERDADAVLRDIRTVVERAMAEGDHRSALKGLELEGRHIGMFEKHNSQRRPMVTVIDFTNGKRSVTAGVTADHDPSGADGQPSD